jgi:hypothetical protein
MSTWSYTMDERGWNVEHVHDWITVSLNVRVLRLHVFMSKRLEECWMYACRFLGCVEVCMNAWFMGCVAFDMNAWFLDCV